MVIDVLRAYVQVASGLTELTRERAMTAAKALISQAGSLSDAPAESSAQVRALADELAKAARGNRDVVLGMVRAETERAVAAVGAASLEDFDALRRRVDGLEIRLDELAREITSAAAAEPGDAEPYSDGVDMPGPAAAKTAPVKKTSKRARRTPPAAAGAAAAKSEKAAPESPGAAADELDVPTPAEVGQVVAKKNAAKRATKRTAKKAASPPTDPGGQTEPDARGAGGDDGGSDGLGLGQTTGAGHDTATTDSEPVQDPTPPDVSTA